MDTPHPKARTRRIAIVGSIALLMPAMAVPALAHPPTGEWQSASREGREDARFDAASNGLDAASVEETVAFQEAFNRAVDPIILANESIFSEAGFNDDGSAYVAFTEALPNEHEKIISQLPRVELIDDAPIAAVDADKLMLKVSTTVIKGLPDDATALVHISPLDGTTVVSTSESLPAAARDDVKKTLANIIPVEGRSLSGGNSSLDFDVDSTLTAESEAVNGGDKLTLRGTTTHACTAAFPARSGSASGLLTAGHCSNSLTVDHGNRLYDATHQRTRANGDMQWHRSRETVNPQFRHAWGSYRPVQAHPVLKVGTRVCRFGATTGNGTGCTTVTYVSACIAYDNTGTYCTLAMTSWHTGSAPGDSGGPWYYGNNAYGIHSGSGRREGANRNWFYPSRVAVSINGLTPMYG